MATRRRPGQPSPLRRGAVVVVASIGLARLNLSGPLAPELGQLDRLEYLAIYDNHFTGPIPKELVGLSNLINADFSNNDFCGPIPTAGPFKHIPRRRYVLCQQPAPGQEVLDGASRLSEINWR
uniref:LRR receptor-like serine/threonine-protein kinase n=1 Tax=Aegilops tauschii TaxID=37682 RepID=M8BGT5_AEGTA